jgi:hypothetical protein
MSLNCYFLTTTLHSSEGSACYFFTYIYKGNRAPRSAAAGKIKFSPQELRFLNKEAST